MSESLLDMALEALKKRRVTKESDSENVSLLDVAGLNGQEIKKVRNNVLSYTARHRGQWFKPEYDFGEIQIAQDTDSYIFRSIKKKTDRVNVAGYEFVGPNSEAVKYIRQRIKEMSIATNQPFGNLIEGLVHDCFRYSNHLWIKVRDRTRSSGKVRTDIRGNELDPVAGYFTVPFETLEFKTRKSGEIYRISQILQDGQKKEWGQDEFIHFYTNRKPGFSVGTPEIYPVLDDVALLRRIEENVEELIETNLFPTYHFKIGNDAFPERYSPEGVRETDVVKRKVEYMPSGSVYVSDHRHEITAIGSEGRALRIDFYLTYFKNRVLAGLGSSALDMGEGTGATKSTAGSLSKSTMMDIEATLVIVKRFIDFYVINELLLEGGFNPLEDEDVVEIQFGVIDKEDKRADENHAMQLFQGKAIMEPELRHRIGSPPLTEEDRELSYLKLYEEPLALLKGMGAGSAAGETLAGLPQSNVQPEHINKEKQFAKEAAKAQAAAKAAGKKPNSSSTGSNRAASSRAKPSNQHGTRSTAKTTRDYELEFINHNDIVTSVCFRADGDISDEELELLVTEVNKRLRVIDVDPALLAENILKRIRG